MGRGFGGWKFSFPPITYVSPSYVTVIRMVYDDFIILLIPKYVQMGTYATVGRISGIPSHWISVPFCGQSTTNSAWVMNFERTSLKLSINVGQPIVFRSAMLAGREHMYMVLMP